MSPRTAEYQEHDFELRLIRCTCGRTFPEDTFERHVVEARRTTTLRGIAESLHPARSEEWLNRSAAQSRRWEREGRARANRSPNP